MDILTSAKQETPMRWKLIETFRAVMLTRSMTVAAHDLHTSQPNVSRAIGQLEEMVGFPLFVRLGGRLTPTPEAEAFFQSVQRWFLGMEALADSAKQIREVGSGTLRIGAVASLAMSVMPEAMHAFRLRYPDASVSIHTGDSATVAKWTANRYVDLGLVTNLDDTPGLQSTLWAEENGVCIVPEGHRLAGRAVVRSADLDDETFISLTQGDGTRAVVDAAFVPDRRRLTLDAPYSAVICRMVSLGLGVSVLNPLVVRHLDLAGIQMLPFEPRVNFARYILMAQQQAPSVLMRVFVECLDGM